MKSYNTTRINSARISGQTRVHRQVLFWGGVYAGLLGLALSEADADHRGFHASFRSEDEDFWG